MKGGLMFQLGTIYQFTHTDMEKLYASLKKYINYWKTQLKIMNLNTNNIGINYHKILKQK